MEEGLKSFLIIISGVCLFIELVFLIAYLKMIYKGGSW